MTHTEAAAVELFGVWGRVRVGGGGMREAVVLETRAVSIETTPPKTLLGEATLKNQQILKSINTERMRESIMNKTNGLQVF